MQAEVEEVESVEEVDDVERLRQSLLDRARPEEEEHDWK